MKKVIMGDGCVTMGIHCKKSHPLNREWIEKHLIVAHSFPPAGLILSTPPSRKTSSVRVTNLLQTPYLSVSSGIVTNTAQTLKINWTNSALRPFILGGYDKFIGAQKVIVYFIILAFHNVSLWEAEWHRLLLGSAPLCLPAETFYFEPLNVSLHHQKQQGQRK
jgi:hypothetical protein